MAQTEGNGLTEISSSVHIHLGILQNVIQRMASNSSQCKTWCITIVSAILVIVANKDKPDFAWIALLPSILFLSLDVYYLTLEKSFRASYNKFVDKIHDGSLSTSDLYSVESTGSIYEHLLNALKSFSILGFYPGLIVLVVVARWVVLP